MTGEEEFREVPGNPPQAVWTETEACPYRVGRQARFQIGMPLAPLSDGAFAEALANGQRRLGSVLYRTDCDGCRSCVPIRLPVSAFAPNRSQRRAWRVGQDALRSEVGPIEPTREKCRLYERHKRGQDLVLQLDGEPMDPERYDTQFAASPVESFEIRYHLRSDDRLVGVAIVDAAANAWSAVYTYWDTDLAHLRPGVFSILTQIDLCRKAGMSWLYLGFWVAECPHMAYKAGYRPHQLRVGSGWQSAPVSDESPLQRGPAGERFGGATCGRPPSAPEL